MQGYEISQKILSIGATYQVRDAGGSDVRYTVKGKVLTATPKLTMVEGSDGAEVARVQGNFFKTRFSFAAADGSSLGLLEFPLIAIKKTFSLQAGGQRYQADGGLMARAFTCADGDGNTVFEIKKELALKDKFSVQVGDALPHEVALLAAVAIDQKFFENDDD